MVSSRVAIGLLFAVSPAGGCSCESSPTIADPAPAPSPAVYPSSEAIQAVTGFPAEVFDGPLGQAELIDSPGHGR